MPLYGSEPRAQGVCGENIGLPSVHNVVVSMGLEMDFNRAAFWKSVDRFLAFREGVLASIGCSATKKTDPALLPPL